MRVNAADQPKRSALQQFFLEPQLTLLEQLNLGKVWGRTAHFLFDLSLQTRMFDLKGTGMSRFHEHISSASSVP